MGVMVQIIQAPAEGRRASGRPVPVQIAFQRDGMPSFLLKDLGST